MVYFSPSFTYTYDSSSNRYGIQENVNGALTAIRSLLKDYNREYSWYCHLEIPPDVRLEDLPCNELISSNYIFINPKSKSVSEKTFNFIRNCLRPWTCSQTNSIKYVESEYESYREMNYTFFEAMKNSLNGDEIIWVHGTFLMLLPKLLKDTFPNLKIGYFLHTPYPSIEAFCALPRHCRDNLLKGVLGANHIGFLTYDYFNNFTANARRWLGIRQKYGRLYQHQSVTTLSVNPITIDAKVIKERLSQKTHLSICKTLPIPTIAKLVISAGRLDDTKGYKQQLDAYKLLLKSQPKLHGRITLLLITATTAKHLTSSKRLLLKSICSRVEEITQAYSTKTWRPIHHITGVVKNEQLVDWLSVCDVALITPTIDGMNLVAKEFVAAQSIEKPGVLILSESAGASKELTQALIVCPTDIHSIYKKLYQALTMSDEEKKMRIQKMQKQIDNYTINQWAEDFIDSINQTQTSLLDDKQLQASYNNAKRRLLIFDVNFSHPSQPHLKKSCHI